jgi:hypothetical protein
MLIRSDLAIHAVEDLAYIPYISFRHSSIWQQIIHHHHPAQKHLRFAPRVVSELAQSAFLLIPLVVVEHLQDVRRACWIAVAVGLDPALHAVDVIGEPVSIVASLLGFSRLLLDLDRILLAVRS